MANAGRVLILAKGAWVNTTNYSNLDLVTKGSTAYLARQSSIGVDPSTDSTYTYWQPFGSSATIATTSAPGLVMPDGTSITVDNTGLIKAALGVNDLTNVSISTLSDGQVLKYNSSTLKWENVSLGSAASKSTTNAVTQGSTALVESGAVYTETSALNSALSNYALKTQITNPNLLDNPWFTVNQREITSWTTEDGTGYRLDRWKVDEGNGSFTSGVIQSDAPIYQIVTDDVIEPLLGRKVTVSCWLSDDTIEHETVTMPSTLTSSDVTLGTGKVKIVLHDSNKSRLAQLDADYGYKAIKVEVGEISTLALDTKPNYQQELAKCLRYFTRIKNSTSVMAELGIALARTQTVIPFACAYTTYMRTSSPTITTSPGALYYTLTDSASAVAATSVSGNYSSQYGRVLNINGTNLTPSSAYRIMLASGGYIAFSSDL